MRAFDGDKWSGEYLDATPSEHRVRVEVHRQVALFRSSGIYFVRQAKLSMLLAYLRALGPRRVYRKVRSRRSESRRNDSWVSVGLGLVEGEAAIFVLTSGPAGATRTLASRDLVHPWPADVPLPPSGHLRCTDGAKALLGAGTLRELEALAGWAEGFGPAELTPRCVAELVGALSDPHPPGTVAVPPAPREGPVRERVERSGHLTADPGASSVGFTCFGYGQYAKTQAIANLGRHVRLEGIHEIDPLQLGEVAGLPGLTLDTSPVPRAGAPIRNAVLAGYHHTHAPLAVELLDSGARHVVIEKPLATSFEQLDALLGAMARNPDARVHAAFQRRHAPFNRLVARDIGIGSMSMSATVYEVPLPARHWYRWPVVGNSVVSNGCHWIDYFLFLNDFAAVRSHHAVKLADQVVLGLELVNGSSCSISLRHEGSPRLGVRDLITLWRDEATVVIEDNSRYTAELAYRSPRRARCPRLQSHEDMYVELGRRMAADDLGDSPRSIDVSTRAMLHLAELVDAGGGTHTVAQAGSDEA